LEAVELAFVDLGWVTGHANASSSNREGLLLVIPPLDLFGKKASGREKVALDGLGEEGTVRDEGGGGVVCGQSRRRT
jgi:hypothetical protein